MRTYDVRYMGIDSGKGEVSGTYLIVACDGTDSRPGTIVKQFPYDPKDSATLDLAWADALALVNKLNREQWPDAAPSPKEPQ